MLLQPPQGGGVYFAHQGLWIGVNCLPNRGGHWNWCPNHCLTLRHPMLIFRAASGNALGTRLANLPWIAPLELRPTFPSRHCEEADVWCKTQRVYYKNASEFRRFLGAGLRTHTDALGTRLDSSDWACFSLISVHSMSSVKSVRCVQMALPRENFPGASVCS